MQSSSFPTQLSFIILLLPNTCPGQNIVAFMVDKAQEGTTVLLPAQIGWRVA
jgi:hypothetical protein